MVIGNDIACTARPRYAAIAMIIIGTAVLAFAVYRADRASFTHDESYTYLHYPHQSLRDILTHQQAYTNNHLLSTLGMKCTERLFGTSELTLRLPTLLFFVIYLVYAALLLRRLSPWIAVAGFILLCTDRDLIELFTLARGYGISFGAMLMALFHLVQARGPKATAHLAAFHVACILAVLANFTMLDVYAAGLAVYYGAHVLEHGLRRRAFAGTREATRVNAVMLLIATAVLWMPVRHTFAANSFDFGGRSFYGSTVRTLAYRLLPTVPVGPGLLLALQIVFTAIVIAAVAVVVRRAQAGDTAFFAEERSLVVTTGMLLLVCLASVAQHFLFGTDYLEARFAMFLLPLLLLVFILLADHVRRRWGGPVVPAVMMALAAGSAFLFVRSSGPYVSNEWRYDVCTKDAMRLVKQDIDRREGVLRIHNSWELGPTIDLYRTLWHIDRLAPEDHGEQGDAAYLYVLEKDRAAIDTTGHVRLAVFPAAETVLFGPAER